MNLKKLIEKFDEKFNKSQFEEIKNTLIKIENDELNRLKNNISYEPFASDKNNLILLNNYAIYIKNLKFARNINTLIKLWRINRAKVYSDNLYENDFWHYLQTIASKIKFKNGKAV